MSRNSRTSKTAARIQALRGHPQPYQNHTGNDLLPRARLAAGQFARVGLLNLLGIDSRRYRRELRLGLNEVFRLGPGLFALEVPHDYEGPWTDWLEEALQ